MRDRWPEKVEDVLRKRGDETGAPRRSLLSWRRSPAEDGQKKLGTTLELLQWKTENGTSDKGFENLLK